MVYFLSVAIFSSADLRRPGMALGQAAPRKRARFSSEAHILAPAVPRGAARLTSDLARTRGRLAPTPAADQTPATPPGPARNLSHGGHYERRKAARREYRRRVTHPALGRSSVTPAVTFAPADLSSPPPRARCSGREFETFAVTPHPTPTTHHLAELSEIRTLILSVGCFKELFLSLDFLILENCSN